MKNIHIIPTDKPSRLWTNNLRRRLELDEFPEQHPTNIAKHIYITNDEEIKEGDWHFKITNNSVSNYKLDSINPNKGRYKKIILTTDQDLIADGVQTIDNTFLEWFVKNPSCEFIKIINNETGNYREFDSAPNLLYKIIIPQEEPKKEVTGVDDNRPKPNYCYAKEQGHGEIGCVFPSCHCGLPVKQEEPKQIKCYCGHTITCDCEPLEVSKEPKQEKDLAYWKENAEEDYMKVPISVLRYITELEERMYSEEEVKGMCDKYHNQMCLYGNVKAQEWFEQNIKKK
jgi:hypothetical protein